MGSFLLLQGLIMIFWSIISMPISSSWHKPPMPQKCESFLITQNLRYVDPHLNLDGSYVPGYYEGPRAHNPYYFNPEQNSMPMPQTPSGAIYFQLNPELQPNPLTYSPYFDPSMQ